MMLNVKQLWMGMILLILAVVIVGPVRADGDGDQARRWFEAGNSAYRDGRYQEAMAAYQTILDAGWTSSEVLFNMGNAAYRGGRPGEAVLWYERALIMDPRDSDVRFNLRYIRRQVQSQTLLNRQPGIQGWLWRTLLQGVSINELTVITVMWFVLFAVGVVLGVLLPRQARLWRLVNAVCLGFLVITCAAAVWKGRLYQPIGIVTAEVDSTFEPRAEATVHLSLKPGSQVFIEKQDGAWTRIRRSDGKVGWVSSRHVGPLMPDASAS
jgi:hypothetical protein